MESTTTPQLRPMTVHAFLHQALVRLESAETPAQIDAIRRSLFELEDQAKGLDISVQLDIQENLRRCDRAYIKAIHAGQKAGWIKKKGDNDHDDKVLSSSFFRGGSDVTEHQAIGSLTDAEFEEVLRQCRKAGRISRRHITTVIKGMKRRIVTRDDRANEIRKLAGKGYASRQMVDQIGVTEETIRQIARDYKIEIPADRVLQGTHRREDDVNGITDRTIVGVSRLIAALDLVDHKLLDPERAEEWIESLTESIAALNHLKKKIKETSS